MRIIAVDDDHNVLNLLQVIFSTDTSIELEGFSSPQAALRAINGCMGKFDCILLDVMMPEMDGVTLCKKIKANPRYKDIPIVMLTANSDKDCISNAFAAGATDYIYKPFDIHEVLTRIRLAKELCSARNEIRALRMRAEIEKRRNVVKTAFKSGDTTKEVLGPKSKQVPPYQSVAPASGVPERKDPVTRSEVTHLFSNDFIKHDELYRVRERKRIR